MAQTSSQVSPFVCEDNTVAPVETPESAAANCNFCKHVRTPLPCRPKRGSSLKWRDTYLCKNDSLGTDNQSILEAKTMPKENVHVQTSFLLTQSSPSKEYNTKFSRKFLTMKRRSRADSSGAVDGAPRDLIRSLHTPPRASSSGSDVSVLLTPLEHQPKCASGVPIIVEACLQYFTKNIDQCERLFRVPGNNTRVGKIWNYLQSHPFACLSMNCINVFMRQHKEFDTNDLASFLKRFIKSAVGKEPLVSYNCYNPLVDAIKNTPPSNHVGRKCRHIIRQLLVPSRRLLLARLCSFLHEFSQHKDTTKMSRKSLATCFINLVQPPPQHDDMASPNNKPKKRRTFRFSMRRSSSPDSIRELCLQEREKTRVCVSIIEALIEHAEYIFMPCVSKSTLLPIQPL